ncbi:hypothetical protein TYRP_021800, partial [Tyrophagus putrescentiae]
LFLLVRAATALKTGPNFRASVLAARRSSRCLFLSRARLALALSLFPCRRRSRCRVYSLSITLFLSLPLLKNKNLASQQQLLGFGFSLHLPGHLPGFAHPSHPPNQQQPQRNLGAKMMMNPEDMILLSDDEFTIPVVAEEEEEENGGRTKKKKSSKSSASSTSEQPAAAAAVASYKSSPNSKIQDLIESPILNKSPRALAMLKAVGRSLAFELPGNSGSSDSEGSNQENPLLGSQQHSQSQSAQVTANSSTTSSPKRSSTYVPRGLSRGSMALRALRAIDHIKKPPTTTAPSTPSTPSTSTANTTASTSTTPTTPVSATKSILRPPGGLGRTPIPNGRSSDGRRRSGGSGGGRVSFAAPLVTCELYFDAAQSTIGLDRLFDGGGTPTMEKLKPAVAANSTMSGTAAAAGYRASFLGSESSDDDQAATSAAGHLGEPHSSVRHQAHEDGGRHRGGDLH